MTSTTTVTETDFTPDQLASLTPVASDSREATFAEVEAAHAEALAEEPAQVVKRKRRTTDEKAEADRKYAFRRRSRSMTQEERDARLAKYPNPETMNIRQFLADCKSERDAHNWCGEAKRYVQTIQLPDPTHKPSPGLRQRRLTLVAEYPQWDANADNGMGGKGAYDDWAINPALPAELTEVPTTVVLSKVAEILRSYNDGNFRYGMENILAAQGVTYVDLTPTYKVTVVKDITPEMLNRHGYNVAGVSDHDRNYYLGNVLRAILRDNYDSTMQVDVVYPNGGINPTPQAS